MKALAIASLLIAMGLAAGPASGSSILISFTPDGSVCEATVAPNTPITVYFLADLYGDDASNGITGAEFQVRNWPGSWFGTPTPNPASNISVGNPIGGGCNIAFPTCQTGAPNQLVLLYTVNAFATTAPTNLTLVVDRHTMPSNPNFLCPLVTICDAVFTKVCVSGGQAYINGPGCQPAVDSATWSQVKDLYSN